MKAIKVGQTSLEALGADVQEDDADADIGAAHRDTTRGVRAVRLVDGADGQHIAIPLGSKGVKVSRWRRRTAYHNTPADTCGGNEMIVRG
jgi:hypothetical protein